jgi:hypothetical protein
MEVMTFNELRRIKDRLPSGSMQRIADDLNIGLDEVRNYFGSKHFSSGETAGIHVEPGPDGGVVSLADRTILDHALKLIKELEQ